MPKTVEVTLYTFEELSATAKERARKWWRECESQEFGAHGELTESAETAAKLLGIEFKTHAVSLMGGGTRYKPNIWWQLHVQGSGASWDGNYSYAKNSVKAITVEFPNDKELQRIARELFTLQKKYRYQLTAKVTADSRYAFSHGMDAEVYDASGNEIESRENAETLLVLMRDFADWIYDGINAEWDYRMDDEQVDDAITENDYTFLADGTRRDD